MIGFLQGTVLEIYPGYCLLLVGGIGYKIFITPLLGQKIRPGEKQNFYIHTHVREEEISLYGFADKKELELFELLLTVSGIGPKTALLVINKGVEQVLQAISQAQVDFFSGIPRLGKKNSQKIIIELKNKIGGVADLDLQPVSQEFNQAVEALVSMGYSKRQAWDSLKELPKGIEKLEDYIRFGLKRLVRKNHE